MPRSGAESAVRRLMRAAGVPLVAAALLALSLFAQHLLARRHGAREPALVDGAFAALGGLRSIAAEVIWFRADRLQEEGRYVEMAQLASALALMEPHTPEVWSYAAWNLAYNVSVMMQDGEDRWRWVLAALSLLRDKGIALNPREPELYRELAWLFELKLGAKLDAAWKTYRAKWRETVEDVRARGAWDELGMRPEKMLEIEKASGCGDWTDPQLSAIYWAAQGVPYAQGRDRQLLLTIIRQARMIYEKTHAKP